MLLCGLLPIRRKSIVWPHLLSFSFFIQAPKPNSPDRMPPSRVVDLALTRADPDDPSAGLLATWTAPGDDYSDGAVAGYKLVYSADTTDLLDSFAGNLKYQVRRSLE